MEASRRIELLYTDLQSTRFSNEINAQAQEKYQDKSGTYGELDTLANSHLTKENAAAAGPRNGAENVCEASQLPEHYCLKAGVSATPKYASDAHDRASRMLTAALMLEDFDAWAAASAVWVARLTDRERASLAWAALRSLDEDQAADVAETVIGGAGAPLTTLLSEMSDARWWARIASRRELKSYALASFEAMSPRDRAAFLRHVAPEIGRAVA